MLSPDPDKRAAQLANLSPAWERGQSGNPHGRPSAGAAVQEYVNLMAHATLEELRVFIADPSTPAAKRQAAIRHIRAAEAPDLADFADYLDGRASLADLRGRGVDTSAIRKAKVRTRTDKDGGVIIEREIELHDRGGADFDRICDRTTGRPRQALTIQQNRPHRSPDEVAAELMAELRSRSLTPTAPDSR